MKRYDLLGFLGFLVLWFPVAFFNGSLIYIFCFFGGTGSIVLWFPSLIAMVLLFTALVDSKRRLRWFLIAVFFTAVACVVLLWPRQSTVQY